MGLSIAWWRLARAQKAPEELWFQVFRRDDNDRKIYGYCNTPQHSSLRVIVQCVVIEIEITF